MENNTKLPPSLAKAFHKSLVECEMLSETDNPKVKLLFLKGYETCYKKFETLRDGI